MCGRYSITLPTEALRSLFEVDSMLNLQPRWNMAPTQDAPIVRLGSGGVRQLTMMRWGLVPSWAKEIDIGARMINARRETVAEKPAFRAAYRSRRCLVPADGFYEWRSEAGQKQPYRVARKDRAPFAFAGLWEIWEGRGEGSALETFTVLTTGANEAIAHIHHRMPVMLFDRAAFATWLNGDVTAAADLAETVDPALIEAYPVDRRVGNVRNDDAALIEPAPIDVGSSAPAVPVQGSLF